MRRTLIVFLSAMSSTLLAQDAVTSQPQAETRQAQPPMDNSALQVKPGGQVIKQKDLWTDTGYFHPFLRMPRYFVQDQKAIWTSPFHTAKSDIKYWAIFGGAVGGMIAGRPAYRACFADFVDRSVRE